MCRKSDSDENRSKLDQVYQSQEVLMHLTKKKLFCKFGVYYIWY